MPTLPLILIAVTSLLVAYGIRRVEQNWYRPAGFVALLWMVVIVFSVWSAPDYYFSLSGLLFILLNVILFFLGGKCIPASKNVSARSVDETARLRQIKTGKWMVALGILSGIFAVILLIRDSGYNLNVLLDSGKLMNLAGELTVQRYGGLRLSGAVMLCLTITYLASCFAGMLLALDPGKRTVLLLTLLLIPMGVFTLVYTARAVILFMLVIVFSSFFAFFPFGKTVNLKLFNRKNILIAGSGLMMVLFLFFISQAARMQIEDIDLKQLSVLLDHLRVWFSGNVSAFSIWFDSSNGNGNLTWGGYTFAGFAEWMQLVWRKPGIYQEAYDVNGFMEFSNIYTLFRFLIDDFGKVGCCIFFFVTGWISGNLHNRLVVDHSFTAGALLSGFLMILSWSFISSVFAYNSVLFAWFGFVLIVAFINFREHEQGA